MNAVFAFRRVIPKFGADMAGPLNFVIPFVAVSALLTFCWVAIKSTAGFIVFCVFQGFFLRTFILLVGPDVATRVPDLENWERIWESVLV